MYTRFKPMNINLLVFDHRLGCKLLPHIIINLNSKTSTTKIHIVIKTAFLVFRINIKKQFRTKLVT